MSEKRDGVARILLGSGLRPRLFKGGLSHETLNSAVDQVYRVLDTIDASLLAEFEVRLANIVELANLSSIVGNVLALGIVQNCNGAFTRAGAHKFQDLRAAGDGSENIEIKVALEKNRPKGHLAEGKAGLYLTCRYVLGDSDGKYVIGERGNIVWIWELRLGHLEELDFDVSNTPGDSGKTATVKLAAMAKMDLIYFDARFLPYKRGPEWFIKEHASPGYTM